MPTATFHTAASQEKEMLPGEPDETGLDLDAQVVFFCGPFLDWRTAERRAAPEDHRGVQAVVPPFLKTSAFLTAPGYNYATI